MRHRYIQLPNGELTEVGSDWTPDPISDVHIMPDIKPYKSMIDGREITSRSRHREHLRQHNCIEVGNDSSLRKPRPPLQSPPGLKDAIIRAVNQVEDRERSKKCH